MADNNIPEGYYRGKNGRLYPAKRESLIQRIARERAEREAQELEATEELEELQDEEFDFNPTRNRIGTWPSTFEVIEAPTSDKSDKADKRNRAEQCGYHHDSETLVIIFRAPVKKNKATGTYDPTGEPEPLIRYDGVAKSQWEGLKRSGSTGSYLRSSGLDGHPWSKTTFTQLQGEFIS
jgi:KTSC domain